VNHVAAGAKKQIFDIFRNNTLVHNQSSRRKRRQPGDSPMAVAATQDVSDYKSSPIVKIGRREYSLVAAEALCRRQATGFYWIAGLSLMNMIALAADWNFSMYLGLGATQLIQAFGMVAGKEDQGTVMLAFYAAALAVIALFGFLGWRAQQIKRWPFVLGMSLYAADSVIFLVFQDWFALGFHVFWLLFLSAGLSAVRPIQDARRRLLASSGPDDVAEQEKLPEFLRAGIPSGTATSPAASSST
jgi:hypothetical protein